jgi:hypothetical protein
MIAITFYKILLIKNTFFKKVISKNNLNEKNPQQK